MSVSISAEEHLAKFSLTVKDANEFITANLNQPDVIFYAALDHGVTTSMLNQITNYSPEIICQYFNAAGFECGELDETSILLNRNADVLEKLVNFNQNIGILSNNSIREEIEPQLISPQVPHVFFGPTYSLQENDGLYDAAELGIAHLNEVTASNESIESLFYGALINVFSALDESELMQINAFPDDGSAEEFQTMFLDMLNDMPEPIVWTEEEMFQLVVSEAIGIMNGFVLPDIDFIGRIDPLLSPAFWFDVNVA